MSERKSAGYLGKALLIELRPLAMAMAILAALFGAALAHQAIGIKYPTLIIHLVNVAVILYSAHLVDTYNDLKNREEYQRGYKRRVLFDAHDPEKLIHLNMKHYLYAMLCTYPVAIILSGILVNETGLLYVLFALTGLVLSITYGFGLDRIFLLGDLAWESGVVLAFMGGFYVTALMIPPEIVVMTIILLPILLGAKILDAEPDYEVDRGCVPRKNSIPVKLGLKWSHRLAYILMIIPILILTVMVPALHPSLIIPILTALALVIYSYRYPAEKGVYFVAGGIVLFLSWAIIVLGVF